MPRTTLVKKTVLGNKTSAYASANVADLAMAAADVGNGNQYLCTGNELLVAWNSNVGAQTVTVTSSAEQNYLRTGAITAYSIGAGEYAIFGPFPYDGWKQSDGYVYVDASSADVKLGVIQLG